ncbi:hypothetical protein Chor_011890 [Crotalus horridus]
MTLDDPDGVCSGPEQAALLHRWPAVLFLSDLSELKRERKTGLPLDAPLPPLNGSSPDCPPLARAGLKRGSGDGGPSGILGECPRDREAAASAPGSLDIQATVLA